MLSILQQHQAEFTTALIRQQGDYSEFTCNLKNSSKIAPQLALDIYRNNTRSARIDTLELVFPVCNKILGNEVFRSIAREYVISDNDGLSDLNHYGEVFNRHFQLLLNIGRLPEEYVYLPDLAKLEFIIHDAYYADNDPEFNFKLFEQKINNEEPVYFQISASLGLVKSEYPIYKIWLNNQKQQIAKTIYAIEDTQYLLVHRDSYKPVVSPVSKFEYLLLAAFINDFSFQEAIENKEYNIDVILPKLIANKWIAGIK